MPGPSALHMRACAGQRVGGVRPREADQVDNLIREVPSLPDLGAILDNIGLFNSTINTTYSNSRGSENPGDAEILIGLTLDYKMKTTYHVDRLREKLAEDQPGRFFFQPARVVSQILNFGVLAPVDIQLHGPSSVGQLIAWPSKLPMRCNAPPELWTSMCSSCSLTRTLFLNIDRTRAQEVGLSQQDVANSILFDLEFEAHPPSRSILRSGSIQQPEMNTTWPCRYSPVRDRLDADFEKHPGLVDFDKDPSDPWKPEPGQCQC